MQGLSLTYKSFYLTFTMMLVLLSGCSLNRAQEPVRSLQLQQNWELQPGDRIGGYRVSGSLGDISIELNGDRLYAPFDGRVQPNDRESCVIFSTPEVPAYLFRLCGIKQPRYGEVSQGEAIGSSQYLEFATLRRQPDGKWAMVEPAKDILQRTLQKTPG